MPTALDVKLLPKVKDIIARVGRDATFRVETKTHNPATGAVAHSAITDVTVKVTPLFAYDRRFVDGDVIRADDSYVLLAGKDLAFTPEVGMKITIGGKVFRSVAVRPYDSGEQTAAWEVQLRR